jgi:HSP20 family protein
MAQEIKKTEPASAPAPARLDPFSAMRAEMDRVFDSFLGNRWGALPALFKDTGTSLAAPSVDIRENDKEIVVEAELPGLEEKDVQLSLRDGVLSIKGEKRSEREEKKDDYHLTERSYGSFQRSFRVPDSVDEEKISAGLEKGVLRVTLPKKPESVKAEKTMPIGGR